MLYLALGVLGAAAFTALLTGAIPLEFLIFAAMLGIAWFIMDRAKKDE